MNYLSVCSGVEAATVAWHDLGWNPVAFSEIEKFPSEVLAHHYPGVPNLGDMSNYKEWNFGEKTIDLLVGGTPCQSFSVAGLRKGLEDPRGNLALIYVGILNKFKPKWFIWENVPGVLSSSKGRDFGSFLGAVGELGYGFSYRVLDAQNWGIPQRRRRVFVVGHLGDWRPAAEVLFEPESLSRHIEESRKKRKDIAKCLTTGIGTRLDSETDTFVTEDGPMYTLNATGVHGVAHTFKIRCGCDGGGKGYLGQDEKTYTISTNQDQHLFTAMAFDTYNTTVSDTNQTIKSPNGGVQESVGTIFNNMAVRKLTPIECERLQGFPDGYTNIKENCPDGHRYKAMGNSMAVPVMKWIGKRIELVSKKG